MCKAKVCGTCKYFEKNYNEEDFPGSLGICMIRIPIPVWLEIFLMKIFNQKYHRELKQDLVLGFMKDLGLNCVGFEFYRNSCAEYIEAEDFSTIESAYNDLSEENNRLKFENSALLARIEQP